MASWLPADIARRRSKGDFSVEVLASLRNSWVDLSDLFAGETGLSRHGIVRRNLATYLPQWKEGLDRGDMQVARTLLELATSELWLDEYRLV
jgi:hypothetical protein